MKRTKLAHHTPSCFILSLSTVPYATHVKIANYVCHENTLKTFNKFIDAVINREDIETDERNLPIKVRNEHTVQVTTYF